MLQKQLRRTDQLLERRRAWMDLLTGLGWAVAETTEAAQLHLNATAHRDIMVRNYSSHDGLESLADTLRQTGDVVLDEPGMLVWHPSHQALEQQERFQADSTDRLSPRELEVFGWLRHGKSPQEIGKILQRSLRTVQKHQQNIYRKLGIRRLEEIFHCRIP